jgi:hypothetical protein
LSKTGKVGARTRLGPDHSYLRDITLFHGSQ